MPPQRTMPLMKATNMKTERTHEENQERAYIAASRRSDRSLEARVESARRASEIHKRRTGRALRVTEQDVLNEEMYEEEEDDLPLPYRQLTQHLTTGSAEFNRRLAAYLTNHVAVRSALNQIIQDSHGMSANGGENFVGNFSQTFAPSTYAPPMQSPISYADVTTPATQQRQQAFSQQQQNNISTSVAGTQFHMGPLGLSTVNQNQHRAAPYARRTPAQKQDARSMSLSEEIQGNQLKLQTTELNNSTSTPPTPTSTHTSVGERQFSRRGSMPAATTSNKNITASPVMAPPMKPFNSSQYRTPSPSPVLGSNVQKSPSNSSSQSKSDFHQSTNSVYDMNEQHKQSMQSHQAQQLPSAQADLGPLNMALPQNAQDLLYGGIDMSDSLAASMMTGINPQQTVSGTRKSKKDIGLSNGNSMQNAAAHFGPRSYGKPCLSLNLDAPEDSFNIAHPMLSSYSNSDQEFQNMMANGTSSSLPTVMRFDPADYVNHSNMDELWQDFFASDSFNSDDNNGPSVEAS